MKRILTGTTLALVLAAVVHAQATLTGKWEGKTKNGFQIVLDLTATETALTGTLTRDGQPAKITDGNVSKKSFTFKATLGDQTEGFTGGLDGDQITVWMDREGPRTHCDLKTRHEVPQSAERRRRLGVPTACNNAGWSTDLKSSI